MRKRYEEKSDKYWQTIVSKKEGKVNVYLIRMTGSQSRQVNFQRSTFFFRYSSALQ
jgi:hypothetical protein